MSKGVMGCQTVSGVSKGSWVSRVSVDVKVLGYQVTRVTRGVRDVKGCQRCQGVLGVSVCKRLTVVTRGVKGCQ